MNWSKDAGCTLGCVQSLCVMVDYLNALLHLNTSILIIIHLSVDVLESLHTEAVSLGHTRWAHLQTWICGEKAHIGLNRSQAIVKHLQW